MGQGGLGPTAEEVADVGVFRAEVSCRSLDYGPILLGPQGHLLAVIEDQPVNLCHLFHLQRSFFPVSILPLLLPRRRTDLFRACKKLLDLIY